MPIVMYQPRGSDRCFEVEVKEQEKTGDVVLYVGGMPVLYLGHHDGAVHLVPNDVDADTGLLHCGPNQTAKVVIDEER